MRIRLFTYGIALALSLFFSGLQAYAQDNDEVIIIEVEEDELALPETQEIAEVENGKPLTFVNRHQHSAPLDIDENYKDKYKGKKYEYKEREPKKKKPKKPREPKEQKDSPSALPLASIFFYIFVGLGIGLILFILYRVIKDFKSNKAKGKAFDQSKVKVESEEDVEDLEELEHDDLRSRLKLALNTGDLRSATRYYFLLYLNQLEERKILTYHLDKTNYDYLQEISDKKVADKFISLSYLYEYIWYGNKPLTAEEFTHVESLFKQALILKG